MTPQPRTRSATRLYVANLALLTTHQADAAYWHEWDVFGVPGGISFFLAFNLGAVALVAAGLVQVAKGAGSARRSAVFCAGVGLFTAALHAVFLWRDRTAFWTPSSVGVLLGILVLSIAQLLHLPGAPKVAEP